MAKTSSAKRAEAHAAQDAGIARLVQLEERLAGRVRAAEREARAAIEAARSASEAAREPDAREIETAAAAQEAADRARHAERIAALREAHERALERLRSIPPAVLDALAQRALARAIGAPGGEDT